MHVTVTGASRALGFASAGMLLKAGHRVRALVEAAGEFASLAPDERIDVEEVDLLERGAVAEALGDTDAVVHCADFPPHHSHLAFDAARFLLEGIAPGARFVFPTNVWAYGPPQADRVGPEHPKASPAGLGKLRADLEKAILAHGGTVIHLPDVFGPFVVRGWVGSLFRRALTGRIIWHPGDPDRAFELLYIDDAARALVAPLTRIGSRGREYTAPGPDAVDVRGLVDAIERASGQPVRLRTLSPRIWRLLQSLSPRRRPLRELAYLHEHSLRLDGTRARSELGWTPEIGYAEGVRRTVRWWREAGDGALAVDSGED